MTQESPPLFDGTRDGARIALGRLPAGAFYTYLLCHADGLPFYVGKGKGYRVLEHELEAMRQSNIARSNPFKCSTIRKINMAGQTVRYRIDRVYDPANQLDCLRREEALIQHYRRRCDGGSLTNLAAGLGSLAERDPFSTERHAATLSGVAEDFPERSALNLYLAGLGALKSVPIKPLSEYRSRLVAAYPSPKALKSPTLRNGLTLAASAIASGLRLIPGVEIPRVFLLYPEFEDWPLSCSPPEEVAAVIENGAASDILKLQLATLIPAMKPEKEAFRLDHRQVATVAGLLGPDFLKTWDLA